MVRLSQQNLKQTHWIELSNDACNFEKNIKIWIGPNKTISKERCAVSLSGQSNMKL